MKSDLSQKSDRKCFRTEQHNEFLPEISRFSKSLISHMLSGSDCDGANNKGLLEIDSSSSQSPTAGASFKFPSTCIRSILHSVEKFNSGCIVIEFGDCCSSHFDIDFWCFECDLDTQAFNN